MSTQQVADYIRRLIFVGKPDVGDRVPLNAGDGEGAEREMITLPWRESDLVGVLLTGHGIIGEPAG